MAPEGRKVGSLKRRLRSHLARWEMKNCTPMWREASRSTFGSQNVESTPLSDPFWKLRCGKSAHCCDVQMSKKCVPVRHETHVQVNSAKNRRVWATFGRSNVFFFVASAKVHLVKSEQDVRVLLQFQLKPLHSTPRHSTHYNTVNHTTTTSTSTTIATLPLQRTPRYTNYNYECNYTTITPTTILQLLHAKLHYTTLH